MLKRECFAREPRDSLVVVVVGGEKDGIEAGLMVLDCEGGLTGREVEPHVFR